MIPLLISLAALAIWALAFGALVIRWRAGRPTPTGVVAAFVLAVAGSLMRSLVGATMYARPTLVLTDEVALAAHVERAMLLLTGLWALALLVRGRR